jgi:prepilin-type N-terminal cleavage/methylation domain-containing protein/prepilin-type processing-associated H-X9-DG protein
MSSVVMVHFEAAGDRPGGPGRRRPGGFTLIELLLVITIITILIGLMLPVLPAIRDSARRVACSSNLQGIGQGITLYFQESRDTFPAARYMPPPWLSGSPHKGFPEVMKRHFDEDSPGYRCPGDRWIAETTLTLADGTTRASGVSYTYMTALSGQRLERTFFVDRLKLNASQVPVMYDFDNSPPQGYETQDGRMVYAPFFHRTRAVLFADGHVDKFDVTERTQQQ